MRGGGEEEGGRGRGVEEADAGSGGVGLRGAGDAGEGGGRGEGCAEGVRGRGGVRGAGGGEGGARGLVPETEDLLLGRGGEGLVGIFLFSELIVLPGNSLLQHLLSLLPALANRQSAI